ncbi:stage V sporulation protein AA [Paenibacillus flagellatus]|uniref:Stage V sporulation protein AA n=1 Tax=Paenibacillus flagellatus TaxID=2211139 RepID=A0A2V5KAA9_9BACL|nr:stage V sporulation protein AA [Paenibacillus flagellatus]PYI55004.1 stage V sporulation protein AA [Paenibacillus flagellatus]
MNRVFTPTLYIRLRKRASAAPGETVTLGRLAQLLTEPDMERELANLPICTPTERDGTVILIDMLHIVKTVRSAFPHVQIEQYGEPHVLIDIGAKPRPPSRVALAIVWLLLFIGSGLAIMNFHVDVSMMEVHQRLYEMITGQRVDHPYWLQIPYSIGLGAGMVLFFNQLFKKRFSEEPSPLEVEMFSYQESLNHYVITEEYRKLQRDEPEASAIPGEPDGERERKDGDSP